MLAATVLFFQLNLVHRESESVLSDLGFGYRERHALFGVQCAILGG
jgi:hypothetical protein